jgi:general stress protein YciG
LLQGPWHKRWGFFSLPEFMTGAVRRRRREPVEKIAISGTAACASLNLAARVAKNRGLDAYAGQCVARDQFWVGFGIYGTFLSLYVAGHDMTRGRTTRKDVNAKNRGFASMDAEKLSQIARKGGRSVPDEKRSFFRKPPTRFGSRPQRRPFVPRQSALRASQEPTH